MPGSHWQYVTYVCFRSDVKIRETETDCKPILDTPMAMTESDVQDPIALFHAWFAEAKEKESGDPTAMALATADAHGRPSLRMVLMKRSEEHTSELQSLMRISYAVFCLKKKNKNDN